LIREKQFSDAIYSAKEFQAVIQRECFRSNRTGNTFSLMVFILRDRKSAKRDCLKIARIFNERVRFTDELGWIGNNCLGVVLPDTPSDRARSLAQDLHSRIGEGHTHGFRIYGYPWDWASNSSKHSPGYPSEGSGLVSGQDNSQFAGREKKKGSEEGIGHFLNRGRPRWKRVVDILGGSI